jgi:hypothetical protein
MPTFLQQHDSRKPIIQIPKIDTTNPAFIIKLAINVKSLIGAYFHFSYLLTRHCRLASTFVISLIVYTAGAASFASAEGHLELAGPGRAVEVAIAVIVAEQIITAGLAAACNGERLVDGGEEVFLDRGHEGDDGVEVRGGVLGIKAAEEVALRCVR